MKKQDVEKERYWQRTIGEAGRSGMSIREFAGSDDCRRASSKTEGRSARAQDSKAKHAGRRGEFCFSERRRGKLVAGLELVLRDGRRPLISVSQGVQEENLRAVLAGLEA